ncbi:8840_t:CDS:2 [Funneliformis geosporum]|nr:8840_t:CDS:2 [Funneliformis geosporum]
MTAKTSKFFTKVRGTQDILPGQALLYQQIQQISQNILNKAGYQPIILPTYEYQALFTTSVGESTDIVQKEMFAFRDRKGRQLVLRPEGTASMLGIELINATGIMAEGELLGLIKQIIQAFGLEKNTAHQLCLDCQKRYQLNPLRILDCKICHLDNLPSYQKLLTEMRGLDYYTGIVFELSLTADQQVILGGGRYDNLFQQLGGVDLPATGLALGVDQPTAYLVVVPWQAELSKNYKIVANLEIKKTKNAFKSINYYLPRLVIIVGQKELKEKKVLIKDCQSQKEFVMDQAHLIN